MSLNIYIPLGEIDASKIVVNHSVWKEGDWGDENLLPPQIYSES